MQMRPSTISWRSVLRQQPCRHQLGRHRQLGSARMVTSGATDRTNTIGFIGLGAMGNHMFNNLVNKSTEKAGTSAKYVLFDVNDAAVEGVIQRHQKENPAVSVHRCSPPYDVVQKASTIITMVPTGRHVEDVYFGDSSVIHALETLDEQQRSSTLCLDQSTIEQSVSRSVALKLRETGADLLDAPVSGGVIGARDGTLAIMVGGNKRSFERAVPYLQPMARKVTYCGDLGAGLAAKISNNLLLGITMLGLSEAMLLGKRLGVDPQVLADIINNSTGRCWSSEINHPVPEVKVGYTSPPAHRQYTGGFVTSLAHKDLALAVKAAVEVNSPLPLGRRVEEVYRPLAQMTEWGSRDFSVVYEALDEAIVGHATKKVEL
ncbi:3-hydroxyisobutyrate dehydrogenase [Colletotrichum aenigma]|uniref:3-hydroxyisobutyrate dehydrogenase n=1 Tax=Colletotrichum aenigma TaxID=1215731 RepID=UPI0018731A0D|nr:3-hydroxyisobutyrate dehydrogenase [Colletotrichum aenigma]KAF5507075.1 3-hydroxyisobutyrate dehydrogenase [Colletotrichum aenigma]